MRLQIFADTDAIANADAIAMVDTIAEAGAIAGAIANICRRDYFLSECIFSGRYIAPQHELLRIIHGRAIRLPGAFDHAQALYPVEKILKSFISNFQGFANCFFMIMHLHRKEAIGLRHARKFPGGQSEIIHVVDRVKRYDDIEKTIGQGYLFRVSV